jgi:hypothetical protein
MPTVTITVSTTPQIQKYLSRLVTTGLFGKNAAEAAERLIARSVEQLGRDGVLPGRAAPLDECSGASEGDARFVDSRLVAAEAGALLAGGVSLFLFLSLWSTD